MLGTESSGEPGNQKKRKIMVISWGEKIRNPIIWELVREGRGYSVVQGCSSPIHLFTSSSN
jgi:hypothetical protein